MRQDELDRVPAGIGEREAHGAYGAASVGRRGRDVVRIQRAAHTLELDGRRTAGQHRHGGTLAEHEPVAPLVEGSRYARSAQGAQQTERGEEQWIDIRADAATERHVAFAGAQGTSRLDDGGGSGSAGE